MHRVAVLKRQLDPEPVSQHVLARGDTSGTLAGEEQQRVSIG